MIVCECRSYRRIQLKGLAARERSSAFQEAKLLRELKHPHVVSYHDSFVHRPSNQLCLVMTFCEGGDLHRKVQAHKKDGMRLFSEARIVQWVLQVGRSPPCCSRSHHPYEPQCMQHVLMISHERLVDPACMQ